jgi:benzoyl-CoA reductase subunit D
MIAAGIDCGARNTKTVILRDRRIIAKGMVPTGFDQGKAVEASLAMAVQQAGIARTAVQRICGTGSGRIAVRIADRSVNEIKAMAQGAFYFFPNARTAADVGAEEGRTARLDDKGNAVDFAVNEKCAAGAGAFIEAMARALEVTIEEMGLLGLRSDKAIPINAQCAIFAESEVVGLIHSNTAKPDICRAIHDSIASRIVSMIRRIGIHEDVVLIGGLARNPGFVSSMTKQLKVGKIHSPEAPEFGAAVGAAVSAAEEPKRNGQD